MSTVNCGSGFLRPLFPLDQSPMMCIKNFPLPRPPIQLSCRVTFASSSSWTDGMYILPSGSMRKGGKMKMGCSLSSWWLVILGSATWLYDHRQGDCLFSRPTAMSPWLSFYCPLHFPLNSVAWKSLAVPGWPVSSLYTGSASKEGKKEKQNKSITKNLIWK